MQFGKGLTVANIIQIQKLPKWGEESTNSLKYRYNTNMTQKAKGTEMQRRILAKG